MKFYLKDGSYWNTVTEPETLPQAIAIGPYTFVVEGDHYREAADPNEVDRAWFSSDRQTLSYYHEDGVPNL